ncbi:MAG: hypothetical protein HC816_10245 [Leptolyngbyaceae cyanobacterium RM1_1_2]|nr:hypothetical protein [Leptolyngbyaceae cyanobacterium RM1_1_2]
MAQVPLTRAQVEAIRNRVELIPQGRSARLAQVADVLGVGDALRTEVSARAELRFNDGSLARIGERATFRFVPNTRNFRLSNGTVLLLIPPGRGRTNIQTPNAVTGIQGSALFVRYDPETDTTIIGALTQNPLGPMVASNRDATEFVPLNAGQLAVIQGDRPIRRYQFDLDAFYQTSSLASGLNLTEVPTGSEESSLAAVRLETSEALESQDFSEDVAVIENPDFTSLSGAETPAASDVADSDGQPLIDAAGADIEGEFAVIPTDPFSAYAATTVASVGVSAIASSVATEQTTESEARSEIPSGLIGRKQPRQSAQNEQSSETPNPPTGISNPPQQFPGSPTPTTPAGPSPSVPISPTTPVSPSPTTPISLPDVPVTPTNPNPSVPISPTTPVGPSPSTPISPSTPVSVHPPSGSPQQPGSVTISVPVQTSTSVPVSLPPTNTGASVTLPSTPTPAAAPTPVTLPPATSPVVQTTPTVTPTAPVIAPTAPIIAPTAPVAAPNPVVNDPSNRPSATSAQNEGTTNQPSVSPTTGSSSDSQMNPSTP